MKTADSLDIVQQSVKQHARGIAPLADIEKAYILRALDAFEWNIPRAAEALGLSFKTIYNRLNSWGVTPADERLKTPASI